MPSGNLQMEYLLSKVGLVKAFTWSLRKRLVFLHLTFRDALIQNNMLRT